MTQLLHAAGRVLALRDGTGHSLRDENEAFEALAAAVANHEADAAQQPEPLLTASPDKNAVNPIVKPRAKPHAKASAAKSSKPKTKA